MKTLLGLGVGVALLAGMMLAGGCVSRSDYDEALAAARARTTCATPRRRPWKSSRKTATP